jgi:uncharacterized phage protein (TIGR02220 family)
MQEKNGYILSRQWFDFAFDNPEKISANHAALMFWLIELNNKLGWKKKFGLPTVHSMEALGVKSYNTYIKILNDLIEWGFVELIEKAKNQYRSNIISLNNISGSSRALSNALSNFDNTESMHRVAHNDIDKQLNNKTIKPNVEKLDTISEIIFYLNKKTNKSFRENSKTAQKLIIARLNEGYKIEDFTKVIENMSEKWLNDPEMNTYLRPETLFGNKFESYLNSQKISKKAYPQPTDVLTNIDYNN